MSEVSVSELSNKLRDAITQLDLTEGLDETGIVVRVGDGVAWIHGLKNVGYNEMLKIEADDTTGSVEAFALNLGEDEIGAVILGDDTKVKAGAKEAEIIMAHPNGVFYRVRYTTIFDKQGKPIKAMGTAASIRL